MNYSKVFIQKVLEATNLVDLISENGITLNKSGTNYKGLCPFHSEKTPSFNVNPLRGYFYCFGCKISGDGIKFLMQHSRLSFVEAVGVLANKANIPLEKKSIISPNRNLDEDEGLNCLKDAVLFYKAKLSTQDGENTANYLRKRKVSERMWKKFDLGASPNDWHGVLNYLKGKNKLVKNLFRTGLVKFSEKSESYYDTFRARLMFPIKDIHGRCIGFGARTLNPEDNPKYLNSPETTYYRKSNVLYGLFEGLSSIRKLRQLIFVEGYLDVIRLHENGFSEAVATCGTALTHNHLKIIKRYAENIILIFDGDNAGKVAALKYTHLLLSYAFESYVVSLPEGEDPDSFLLIKGKDAFEKMLGNKIPALDYLVKETLKKFENSIQGRMQCMEELLPTLSNISDMKRRQLTLMAISERMGIPPEMITQELQKKSNKNLSKLNINGSIQSLSSSKVSQDELWLLQSLLRKGNLWPIVRQHLSPEEFKTPYFKKLYARLLEFPDSVFQPFDPLKLEKSDPRLFQAVMNLLKEEIRIHDFGLSLMRIKERNLELSFRDSILKSESNEERAKIGARRRKEEKKIKDVKLLFDGNSTC